MPMTLQDAQRKARFGHRDWIGYGPKGARHYAPMTKAELKAALLQAGTQGRFTVISADTGHLMGVGWRVGVGMLRNFTFLYSR